MITAKGKELTAALEKLDRALSRNIEISERVNDLLAGVDDDGIKIDALESAHYRNDAFFKTVRPKPSLVGAWKLDYGLYKAHQPFTYDEITADAAKFFKETTKVGCFDEDFSFLEVKENNITWMSVTPHEINTMSRHIEKAKGRVLVLGLGLGYFPFHVSNKDEVSSVTIVERNTTAIKLFEEKILPFFPNGEKIKIAKDDAVEFLRANVDNYDFVFADLWHTSRDALLTYPDLLKIEERHKDKVTFSYWIEGEILIFARRALIAAILDEADGLRAEDFRLDSKGDELLVAKLYHLTKNMKAASVEDLLNKLSDSQIRLLAKSL